MSWVAHGALSETGVELRSYGWLKVLYLKQVYVSGAMGSSRCSIRNRCGAQEPCVAQGALSETGVGLRSHG